MPSAREIAKASKKVADAFPALPPAFYKLLIERFEALEFTEERMHAAVNSLIDNFTYPRPTIADIVSYDKRIALITYHEMCDLAMKHGAGIWDEYVRLESGRYADRIEAEKYGLIQKQENDKI